MDPNEDHSRHDTSRRVGAALMWAATAGALLCSAVIFLVTNTTSPEPVAEPMPSVYWPVPVATSSIVETTTQPSAPLAELAPPPAATTTTTTAAAVAPPVITTNGPASPPRPPAPTTAFPPRPATVQLHAVGTGKCLDVAYFAQGAQLRTVRCDVAQDQSWQRTPAGQLTVTVGGATQCMDAYGMGTQPGTQVIIWPCNGQPNQRWTIHSNGTITGVQSGLCLDVTGASTADGAPAQLWNCNGGSNQQWSLG